ncbi:hypothetical protein NDU88_008213 [Pleurodeles waltl]|uniref:Uncharacterized protein n=1 Tax=Pleurodeles waltl TaxID=8319 RepID=A0AAV7NVD8_PLEWA|nr:hypothetical protein NDU88_008213 [Pleurodeles waltl]
MGGKSQPGSSQAVAWAVFIEMAQSRGLDWVMGIMKAQEQEKVPADSHTSPANPRLHQSELGPPKPKKTQKELKSNTGLHHQKGFYGAKQGIGLECSMEVQILPALCISPNTYDTPMEETGQENLSKMGELRKTSAISLFVRMLLRINSY